MYTKEKELVFWPILPHLDYFSYSDISLIDPYKSL